MNPIVITQPGGGSGPAYDDTAIVARAAALEAQSVTVPAFIVGDAGVEPTDLATDYVTRDIFTSMILSAGASTFEFGISGDPDVGQGRYNFQVLDTDTIATLLGKLQAVFRTRGAAWSSCVFTILDGCIVAHLGSNLADTLTVVGNPHGNLSFAGGGAPSVNARLSLRDTVMRSVAVGKHQASVRQRLTDIEDRPPSEAYDDAPVYAAIAALDDQSVSVPAYRLSVMMEPSVGFSDNGRQFTIGNGTAATADITLGYGDDAASIAAKINNAISTAAAGIEISATVVNGQVKLIATGENSTITVINGSTVGGAMFMAFAPTVPAVFTPRTISQAIESIEDRFNNVTVETAPAVPGTVSTYAAEYEFVPPENDGFLYVNGTQVQIFFGLGFFDVMSRINEAVGPSGPRAEFGSGPENGKLVLRAVETGPSSISVTGPLATELFGNGVFIEGTDEYDPVVETVPLQDALDSLFFRLGQIEARLDAAGIPQT